MSRAARRPRAWRPLVRAAMGSLLLGALTAACGPETEEPPPATVSVLDSFLVELGQLPTAALNRSQRWRMVSSIWVGLPPPGYTRDSLPESDSHEAALLQTYCEQCHWMPSPQMHAAAEWPLLVRRMLLRARTVQERMGGPLTEEILGRVRLLEGMGVARIPSAEEQDSLIAYLQGYAPALAVEMARKTVLSEQRPSFHEVEDACAEVPAPAV